MDFIRRFSLALIAAGFAGAAACAQEEGTPSASEEKNTGNTENYETAIFAGGCFWCVEADLEKLDGIGDVVSGYSGGDLQNPTYRNHGQHLEVVQAPFDPAIISYRELTDYFLRTIDPLDAGGQFCDRGNAYTTAIFYANDRQKADAEAAVAAAEEELGQEIVTPVLPAKTFWRAEEYHQEYYKKNPVRYKYYRTGCRRDARVAQIWGE